jgi:hypothetical protein
MTSGGASEPPPIPNQIHDAWDALSERLPGLRRLPLTGGLSRHEVGALLARIEATVRRDVAGAFAWDADGVGRFIVSGRSYRAGRFTTPSIGELEARVRRRTTTGDLTFSVVVGDHALTDIGALQAMAGPGTLFQVASQFNCLEAPGPTIVPIADYVSDNTQGPRASVSAFPGTFLRHYAAPAPDGTRFTQSSATQIELLADAIDPDVAQIVGGYLMRRGVIDPAALERALDIGFEKIRVGVHDDVEVVLGGNWGGPVDANGPTIGQVFTSTMALGAYGGGPGNDLSGCCASLLRAAYLGTLLAALDLGKRAVVLTLIGGGAFGNAPRWIWDAIVWAVDRAARCACAPLSVIVNARGAAASVSPDVVDVVRRRNGAVLLLPRGER